MRKPLVRSFIIIRIIAAKRSMRLLNCLTEAGVPLKLNFMRFVEKTGLLH